MNADTYLTVIATIDGAREKFNLAMTEEVWAPVTGWEGFYSISSLGRVRSEARVVRCGSRDITLRERVLVPGIHSGGYLTVVFCREAHKTQHFVHRLVLRHFVGECPKGMEARHLDGSKTNSRLDNLAWGTPSENTADKERHGTLLRGERVKHAKLNAEQAKRIKQDSRVQWQIAADYGITQTAVSRIKLGKIWASVATPRRPA